MPHVNKRTGEERMVDRGLDPAWATNPGRHRARVLADGLHGKLGRADEQLAQAAVRDMARSPILDGFLRQLRGFRKKHPGAAEMSQFIEARIGELPVAVLDSGVLKALRLATSRNAPSAVVRLSPDTALKQFKHPLAPTDYRRVPDLVARGEVFVERNGKNLVFFAELDKTLFKAAVKRTAKNELYLTSFRRAEERHRRRERRRSRLVREASR